MPLYNWYKLFNLTQFLATGLTSRQLSLVLEGVGLITVLISRGNMVSVVYDDVFLPIECEGQNPYRQGDYAVYCDDDENIWLGFEVAA